MTLKEGLASVQGREWEAQTQLLHSQILGWSGLSAPSCGQASSFVLMPRVAWPNRRASLCGAAQLLEEPRKGGIKGHMQLVTASSVDIWSRNR